MNHKTIGHAIVTATVVFTLFSTPLHAGEPKPLSKNEAAQLLSLMGYQRIEIGAIVHGVSDTIGINSPNAALVIGIGWKDGQNQTIRRTFLYDAEIGC